MKNQRFLCIIISGSSVLILMSIAFVILSFGEESQSPIQNLSIMRQPTPTPQPYNTSIYNRWNYDSIAKSTPTPVYIASGQSTPTPTPTTAHHNTVNDGWMTNDFALPSGTGYTYVNSASPPLNFTGNRILAELQNIASTWYQVHCPMRIQITVISKQGGGDIGHLSHFNGLDFDIRYIRNDGQEAPLHLRYQISFYHQGYTQDLITLFNNNSHVELIFVTTLANLSGSKLNTNYSSTHEDHFHVRFINPRDW